MSKKNLNQSENVNLLNAEMAAVPAPAEAPTPAENASEDGANPATDEAMNVASPSEDTHTTSESVDLSYRGMQHVMSEANTRVKKRVVNLDSVCAGWYKEMQTDEKLRTMLAKIGVSKKADFKPAILFGRFYVDGCLVRVLRGQAIEKYKDDAKKVVIFAAGQPRPALKVCDNECGDKLFNAAKNAIFSLIRDGYADDIKADKEAREAARKAKKQAKKNKK